MEKLSFNTTIIGHPYLYLPVCHSTNDYLMDLSDKENLDEGTTVLTKKQTAGRGQRGNTWEAQEGENFTFSMLLKPKFLSAENQFALNVCISLAVYNFLKSLLQEGIFIKWPNDLFYQNKKLGGMLIENTLSGNQITQSIVGIGLNINQVDFTAPQATSLKKITNRNYSLENLFPQLVQHIEQQYLDLKNGMYTVQKQQYIHNLYRFQESHLYQTEEIFEGIIIGVDETGRLEIERNGKVFRFNFKEIAFVYDK